MLCCSFTLLLIHSPLLSIPQSIQESFPEISSHELFTWRVLITIALALNGFISFLSFPFHIFYFVPLLCMHLFLLDMHKVNFFHRGIKPENILFDREWKFNLYFTYTQLLSYIFLSPLSDLRPKLADPFSIRRYDSSATPQHPSCFIYQSPESLLNGLSTPAMDIWGLGCVVYELCTLQPPFTDTNSINNSQPVPITNFTGLSILRSPSFNHYFISNYLYQNLMKLLCRCCTRILHSV